MRVWLSVAFATVTSVSAAFAAEPPMRFWNTTSVEIDELYLAHPHTDAWGPNQTLNDKDKSVDADERLALSGVKPGRCGRQAQGRQRVGRVVRNVEVKAGGKYALDSGQAAHRLRAVAA